MKSIITLSLVAATFLFTACGEKAKDTTTTAVESTKEAAHNIVDASKEAAEKAVIVAKKAAVDAEIAAKKALEATKEATSKAMADAKSAVNNTTDSTKEVEVNTAGKAAYAKCAGCHGVDGQTKALGKAPIIGGLPKTELVKMLNAYKAGTRNEVGMGTLMKGQVASMDDASIEAVATYISTLK